MECYPGLVVHGRLQAALLLSFAAGLRGATPDCFSFRSGAPLFDDAPLVLNATDEGRAMKPWTARDGGPAPMVAEAGWL